MMKKGVRTSKLDDLWKIPFLVVDVKNQGMLIKIKKSEGVCELVNIKRIRRFN